MTLSKYQIIFVFFLGLLCSYELFGQNPTIIISEIMSSNRDIIADEYGEYDDWIEIYNYGNLSVDLKGLYFSDDKDYLQKSSITESIIIPARSYHILWADGSPTQGESHLNFKLSSRDDIYISDDSGVIDYVDLEKQQHNISYGRIDESQNTFGYYVAPSPSMQNEGKALYHLSEVKPNYPSGIYQSAINIKLSQEQSASIYYTLDGTTPNETSPQYEGEEIYINANTVLRAVAYSEGGLTPYVSTYTYIFNENSELPILCVTSQGHMINSENKNTVHAELIDENGISLFSSNVTSQKHGHADQISFRFLFGTKHGGEKVYNRLFEYKPGVDEFKSLIFRQAGNDGLNTSNTRRAHLRDGFANTIINRGDFNFKSSGFRQVNVYLDGEYYGLFNMRERIDESFLDNNYDIKSVDPKCFIEYKFDVPNNINPIEGSWSYFEDNLYLRCKDADLSEDEAFEKATKNLDIEDFTDYWIHQVFIGNFDWLTNNMFFWSPMGRNKKFRWILWDTDVSFGLNGDPDWNSLEWATSIEEGRPQNGDRTAIIRALLTNESYLEYFITRFSDLINKEYDPGRLIAILDDLSSNIESELPRHIEKWEKGSVESWKNAIDAIKRYTEERPDCVRAHLKAKFPHLTEMYKLKLECSMIEAGYFKLNTIDIATEDIPWTGLYYDQLPLEVEVFANEGYKFVGWDNSHQTSRKIRLNPDQDTLLMALFEEEVDSEFEVVITEISYTQNDDFDSGDWVEFYNSSSSDIDLSGWRLEDSSTNKEAFIFPEGTVIKANNYFVVVKDQEKFSKVYSDIDNLYGDIDFGLSKSGETIRLYDANQDLVDRVHYLSDDTWPEIGDYNSIQLINVNYDNNKGVSWVKSPEEMGTPGRENPILSSIDLSPEKSSGILNAYPNPTSNYLNLEITNEGFLEVYDLNGKLQLLTPKNISQNTIDVSSFTNGVYIMRFRERNGKFFLGQFVKE